MNGSPDSAFPSVVLPGSEELLWEGRPSLWSYTGWLFLGAILLWVFGAGIFVIAAVFLHRAARRYSITTKRVCSVTGLFSRRKTELAFGAIENVDVSLPELPIAPGLGTLRVEGCGGTVIVMSSIAQCEAVGKLIRNAAKTNTVL